MNLRCLLGHKFDHREYYKPVRISDSSMSFCHWGLISRCRRFGTVKDAEQMKQLPILEPKFN